MWSIGEGNGKPLQYSCLENPISSVQFSHSVVSDSLQPHESQKSSQSNRTRTTALLNSVKLSHARKATQDGGIMVERSERMWSTGEGNGKPL